MKRCWVASTRRITCSTGIHRDHPLPTGVNCPQAPRPNREGSTVIRTSRAVRGRPARANYPAGRSPVSRSVFRSDIETRPSFADAGQHGTVRPEAIVDHGELHHLAERLEVERHLRPRLAGHPGQVLVADVVGGRPFRRERVPGVGQPPVRVGLEHDLRRVSDLHIVLVEQECPGRSGLPVGLEGQTPVAPGEGRVGQPAPELFRRGADEGGVHELGLVHHGVLESSPVSPSC